jgi:hypothetical protein
MQAFGLMELQRGNWLAALMLLERCVSLDPHLEPVLNWTQVGCAVPCWYAAAGPCTAFVLSCTPRNSHNYGSLIPAAAGCH